MCSQCWSHVVEMKANLFWNPNDNRWYCQTKPDCFQAEFDIHEAVNKCYAEWVDKGKILPVLYSEEDKARIKLEIEESTLRAADVIKSRRTVQHDQYIELGDENGKS